jgi:creatinine amidohydrolase
MSKSELCSLTWLEAAEAFKQNPVILIPMASIEQHGPATPVGDYRYTTEISRQVAEATGAISCPTIPWGYSEYFKPFPGTISIRPETLTMILEDHLDCLLRFGLDHIMFVCGHKGDLPILEQLGRKIRVEHKLRVATMEPIAWFTEDWKREVYGVDKPWTGHGTDPMQSFAMHLYPEEVRMDLLQPGNKPVWNDQTFQGTAATFTEGNIWHMYLDYNELTPNGVIGDVTLPSAEVGRRTLDRLLAIGSKVVRRFAEIDTRL